MCELCDTPVIFSVKSCRTEPEEVKQIDVKRPPQYTVGNSYLAIDLVYVVQLTIEVVFTFKRFIQDFCPPYLFTLLL